MLTEGREELERCCKERALVALDFDGTLAPICAQPDGAAPRTRTRELLARVAQLYDCAVISGRARADVVRRLAHVELTAVIGNHGLEPWDATDAMAAAVAGWRAALEARLRSQPGVQIEDKHYSLALHWRRAADRPAARAAALEAAGALSGVRVMAGKQVLNLLPTTEHTKATALDRLRRDLGSDRVIYVGDDITDEDVFARAAPGLLGIRVGRSASSRARWYIPAQRHIDDLLATMIDAAVREGLPPPPGGDAVCS